MSVYENDRLNRKWGTMCAVAIVWGLLLCVTLAPASASGAPSPPEGVTVVAGSRQAFVSWEPPADDGGSPVLTYRVVAVGSGPTVEVDGATLSATVGPLTNGMTYTFRVIAINEIGESSASVATDSVTPVPLDGVETPFTQLLSNGTMYDVERVGTTTFVGGDFTQVGPVTGPFVSVDPLSLDVVGRLPSPIEAAPESTIPARIRLN